MFIQLFVPLVGWLVGWSTPPSRENHFFLWLLVKLTSSLILYGRRKKVDNDFHPDRPALKTSSDKQLSSARSFYGILVRLQRPETNRIPEPECRQMFLGRRSFRLPNPTRRISSTERGPTITTRSQAQDQEGTPTRCRARRCRRQVN